MSAGTLTLTNNSDLVSGAGTSFSTELTAGDFVVATVGGVTYTLPVKSVEGDTEITLISKYPGPTQQGSAWNAVPRATQNQVTAALVVQSTEALRGLNYDKQNWQAVFSVDGHITVMLPDGSSFSGPSWLSIANILNTLDVEYLEQLAAQINQDAQQVETDKNTVVETATQVSTDAQAASAAATGAQGSASNAAESETNAEGYKELARKYALNPEDDPVTGGEYSAFHYSEKARQSAAEAASHNPAEALVKSLNLSDLADRAAAWLNVRPLGATPLAGAPVNDNDAATKQWVENLVAGGVVGATMNGVQNYGVGEKTLWDSRAFIPQWAVPSDGQLLDRSVWPELWAHAQMHSPIDDAEWLSTPSKRGMWSKGDGSTTFRAPDLNGVQDGSIKGLYGRGDGGGFYVPGHVFENGAPDAIGRINMRDLIDSSGGHFLNVGSAAQPGMCYPPYFGTYPGVIGGFSAAPSATATTSVTVQEFALSRANAAYGRSTLEVRGNNFAGVWIIRASGGFIAANTSWSVINEGNSDNAGVWNNGGVIRSTYKINGQEVAACSMLLTEAIDSQGYRNARAQFSVSNKQGNEYFFNFNENGIFQSSNGKFVFANDVYSSGAIYSNSSINAGVSGVIRSRAAEANEIYMQAAPAGQTTGLYINYLGGNWYNGRWTLGGIRSSSTLLQRVQLNVSDGGGTNASYMFSPNGVAQGAQWQNTSDRRVKSCIETIPNPLEVMRSIRGYSWSYEPYGTQGFGFMADEAEKHFPGAVKTTEDFEVEMPDGSKIGDVKSVDTYGIAAALHHEAILAMMDQIEELKAEIKKLKGE